MNNKIASVVYALKKSFIITGGYLILLFGFGHFVRSLGILPAIALHQVNFAVFLVALTPWIPPTVALLWPVFIKHTDKFQSVTRWRAAFYVGLCELFILALVAAAAGV